MANEKDLDKVVQQINKRYGPNTVRFMNGRPEPVPRISTGILSLDIALGGGYPKGRIVEIYGPEMSGKTSLAVIAAAEVAKKGGSICLIDAEHAFNPEFAKVLGLDAEKLGKRFIVVQPDYGEQALDILNQLAPFVDIAIVDSVSALVPKAELEGGFDRNAIGEQARLMSKALRMLTGRIARTNAVVIFINQIRHVGMGGFQGFGTDTTGGRALKFYASQRVEVTRGAKITNANGEIVGHRVRMYISKNKVGVPYKKAEADLYYDRGIDKFAMVLDLGLQLGLIKQAGSWYHLELDGKSHQMGQGREKARQWLVEHLDVAKALKQKIVEMTLGQPPAQEGNRPQESEEQK